MKRDGNYNRRGPVPTIDAAQLRRLASKTDGEIAAIIGGVTPQAVAKRRKALGISRHPRGRRSGADYQRSKGAP